MTKQVVQPTIQLWDPWIRIFHWSLVAIFVANLWITEPGELIHRALGGTALALVVLRFIWGFVGKGAARWSDFFPTPHRIFCHAKALLTGKPYHRMGHSPIGAVVMIALMLLFVGLSTTGIMMGMEAFEFDEWVAEYHEFFAKSLFYLAVIHVLAAIVESFRMKENLPKSMVTGKRIQRKE